MREFDAMVDRRGYESRSHALADMLNQHLAEYKHELGSEIMAGIITLFYDHATSGLQRRLADLQHRHIDEVISSLHVHLMHEHTMEVILVQGPVSKLQSIADELVTQRGVITGKLHLTTSIIPPLHPLPQ